MTDKAQQDVGKLKSLVATLQRQVRELTLKYRRVQHDNNALQIECRRLQHELEYYKRRQNHG